MILKYNDIVVKLALEGKTSTYPLKTIENFLVYFKKIKREDDKNIIVKHLNEYLDYISSYSLSTKEDFVNIYENFIQPFVEVYRKDARFIYFIGFNFLLMCSILINIFLFYKNWVSFLLINSLIASYFSFLILKVRAKRVYAPIH